MPEGTQVALYNIICLMQPKVVNVEIDVNPPKYTGKKNDKITSSGDIVIYEEV